MHANIMIIALNTAAGPQHITLEINERLPAWIRSPCEITCQYEVKAAGNMHLLRFTASGVFAIVCQRCLQSIDYAYTQAHEVAVCAHERDMLSLMTEYDCVVGEQGEVDLRELLTDELVMSLPQIPHAIEDCTFDLAQFN